jgi:hypothetical protein
MAWEKRWGKSFYYRCRRVRGRVKKLYCGGGLAGQIAATIDARRREQRHRERVADLTARARLEEVNVLACRLREICKLLTEAVLLLASYHRPNRVAWRKSRAARRATQEGAEAKRPD